MQFNLLTTLLLSTLTLTLAAPLPAPQTFSSPGNNGSSTSGIITRLNGFINRFSTRPGILAVSDGLTPDNTSPVTQLELENAEVVPVVEEGADIVPVGEETGGEVAQTGNVLQLKKPATVVETAPVVQEAEIVEEEFEVVPAAVGV